MWTSVGYMYMVIIVSQSNYTFSQGLLLLMFLKCFLLIMIELSFYANAYINFCSEKH